MTALTQERIHGQRGTQVIPAMLRLPVAASTKIFAGAMVALTLAGYLTNAVGNDPTQVVVGVARKTVDNSAGNAGDLFCDVERGVFKFANSSTTDALAAADVGSYCYVVDNQTVAKTNGGGPRGVAGKVFDVSSSGVYVLLGVDTEDPSVDDWYLLAAADLSALANTFVAMDNTGKAAAASAAGQDCIGVLLNAPTAGAVARVRVRGRAKVTASATIAIGALLATTSAGKSKAAVADTVNTSDAGASADPVIGSFILGRALEAGANGALHTIDVRLMGSAPTTAA